MTDPDRRRADLVVRQAQALSMIRRGVVSLASVPIVGAFATAAVVGSGVVFVAAMSIIAGGIYCLLGTVYGFAMITSGGIDARRIAKQLREYDARRQLPEARVVSRD